VQRPTVDRSGGTSRRAHHSPTGHTATPVAAAAGQFSKIRPRFSKGAANFSVSSRQGGFFPCGTGYADGAAVSLSPRLRRVPRRCAAGGASLVNQLTKLNFTVYHRLNEIQKVVDPMPHQGIKAMRACFQQARLIVTGNRDLNPYAIGITHAR
jgi:hypothetical protein